MNATPGIGRKIITYLLGIPILLFYGLILAGCTSDSSGIPNLHILQFNVDNQTSVRIGYLGICVRSSTASNCLFDGLSTSDTILNTLQNTSAGAFPADIIEEAISLQRDALLNLIFVAALLFLMGLLVDLLQVYSTKRARKTPVGSMTKRRQNFYRQFALALVWSASSLTLAAAISNTATGRALRIASGDAVSMGKVAIALLWATWTLSLVFAANLTMELRSKSGAAPKAGGGGNPYFGAYQSDFGTNPMGIVIL